MTSASADHTIDGELREGSIVGKYRVVREIGAGQMGAVYEAHRLEGSGRVAIKVVKAQHEHRTEPLRRFQREATLCSGLRHPNIVPVIDYGIWQGKPFLVMPVLTGSDLERVIERVGPLAPEVAVAIALDAARGLQHAHEASIIHRDFKPANVFLDEAPDGSVRAVVCDFGVAKALDASAEGGITATGAVVGTPLYMAPEQLLDSKHVDERVDVWSLGMTLYHMLAGRAAFADVRTFGDLLLAMRDERVPPLQALAPWVQPSLARIVHGTLLPVARRIGKMSELIASLERLEPKLKRLTTHALVPIAREQKALVETQAMMPKSANELSGANEKGDLPNEPPIADQFLGRTLGNRYSVISRLGLGGMGAVYEATDIAPRGGSPREVALKVMLYESGTRDPESVKRFLREAKAAERIASPYVAQVLDTGVDNVTGSPFLVMERLRGRDLGLLLKREGCGLDPEAIVSMFLHACDALAAAHALGIVHRDVKPSNLFVHEIGDGTAVLKICDFGIAKQLSNPGAPEASAELTRTGGLLGSPLYMSPEQAKSAKNVDGRSDVFSLALSLHEALSGVRPWEGRTSMGEIIVAVCTEDVPPLRLTSPWIDPRLAAVIERGLVRDVTQRWQSVAEFGAALRPFSLGRPVKTSEIVGVSPARISSSQPAYATTGPSSSGAGSGVITNNAVSITASQSSSPSKRPVAIIAVTMMMFAAVLCTIGYFAWSKYGTTRGGTTTTSVATKPDAPKEAPSPASTPSQTPTAASTTIIAVAPDAAVATTIATTTTIIPRTTPRSNNVGVVNSAPSTAAPVGSAAPSSTVGRGMTAKDLPP